MAVHQCANFYNNPILVHDHDVGRISKYLASTSTYVDSLDISQRLTTRGIVYRTDVEKGMPTFPVGGIKPMLIMQKIACPERYM